MTEFLARLVNALTDAPRHVQLLTDPDPDRAAESIRNLLRQAPLRHKQRVELLDEFDQLVPELRAEHASELASTAITLAGAPLRIPLAASRRITVPSAYGLHAALTTLLELNESVAEPWTLIGGLMVLLHCLENEAPNVRPTEDADIAVSVFTHPRALTHMTSELRDAGFTDQTPPALPDDPQLSYRWVRDQVRIDVAVPPKASKQRTTPTTVTGRPAIELIATQQALRRTERLPVAIGQRRGELRRPDLLGAIVIKAAAALHDRRDPDRHRQDLVTLADILAFTGRHADYAAQLQTKDRDRIRHALVRITDREWRRARDPHAAQAAMQHLARQPLDP